MVWRRVWRRRPWRRKVWRMAWRMVSEEMGSEQGVEGEMVEEEMGEEEIGEAKEEDIVEVAEVKEEETVEVKDEEAVEVKVEVKEEEAVEVVEIKEEQVVLHQEASSSDEADDYVVVDVCGVLSLLDLLYGMFVYTYMRLVFSMHKDMVMCYIFLHIADSLVLNRHTVLFMSLHIYTIV